MFLKAPQVRLQKVKHSLGIPRIHAPSPQADYAAFLLLYDAPPFGDELLDAAKIVFGVHLSNNAQASLKGDEPKRDNPLYWSTQASLTRTNALFSRRMASCIMIFEQRPE